MEAILTGGQTGPHTLSLITEGVDKPDFQMTEIAGYITTNGIHAACKELEYIIYNFNSLHVSTSVLVTLFLLANVQTSYRDSDDGSS